MIDYKGLEKANFLFPFEAIYVAIFYLLITYFDCLILTPFFRDMPPVQIK